MMMSLLLDEGSDTGGLASVISGYVVVARGQSAIDSSDTTTGVSEALECLWGRHFMDNVTLGVFFYQEK